MMDYKKEVLEMVKKIDNEKILNYIYIIVRDIAKEDKPNEQPTRF